MRKSKVSFEHATTKNIKEFYGRLPDRSLRGWVLFLDGKAVGACGIMYELDHRLAFSDIGDTLRPYKREIAKAIRLVEGLCDETKGPVTAYVDEDEPTSKQLLGKLGFIDIGMRADRGPLWVRY